MPTTKTKNNSKPLTINLHLKGDEITVDDLITIEEGTMSEIKKVLAQMVRKKSGKMLYKNSPTRALNIVGTMPLYEVNNAVDALKTSIGDIVPKDNGTPSG